MRDDARALVDRLVRDLRTKLGLVQKLLLSESDKHHYQKSGNLERVMELTRDDALIIDAVNLADFDISNAEDALCSIIGVRRNTLYETLGTVAEARELIASRERLLRDIGELYRLRRELLARLEADAHGIKDSIAALSRIDALKGPVTDGEGLK